MVVARYLNEFEGNDPRATTKKQLVESGAPLVCKRKADTQLKPSGSRPHMVYMGMQMKRLTEQGVKVTREEKVSLMQQWAEEYRSLPAEQLAELQLTASSRRAQKRRCVEALQDQQACKEQKAIMFRQLGLGMSSVDWPLDPDVADEAIAQQLGARADGRHHGLSRLFPLAIADLDRRFVVKDQGAF